MRRLVAFNNVTLDGYFTGPGGDLSWTQSAPPDAEFDAFVTANASGGDTLILGRSTYELMASYWPTPVAQQQNPVVAARMNSMTKVVFSGTLAEAAWENTTLVRGDIVAEVLRLKQGLGGGIAVLGSGSIVAQLAGAGLIDEYQLVVNPVVVGSGRTMFEGVMGMAPLRLTRSQVFANGKVLLCYEPMPVALSDAQ